MSRSTSGRLQTVFDQLRINNKKALVPYVTAGYPNLEILPDILHALVKGGADAIEIGVPFSDPMADGPVIQKASEHALAGGTTLIKIFAQLKIFRASSPNVPIILMSYLNPIERMGLDVFATYMKDVDLDGVLVVDLPPEESDSLRNQLPNTVSVIHLAAPTTSVKRLERIINSSSGYLYYVSIRGVTGAASANVQDLSAEIDRMQPLLKGLPVLIGFGIKTPQQAVETARICNGVIIGSALIEHITHLTSTSDSLAEGVKNWMHSFRKIMDETF
ncbi:MAG: tryptophan synthase subunit alpha [Pseudomonadota bacterium]